MGKYFKLNCNDFQDFTNKKCNNGILILQLSSLKEFHEVVGKFKHSADYFWRGQRCYCEGWKLKSSFDREQEFTTIKKRDVRLCEILKEFRKKLRDLPEENTDSLYEDEIWAIGQHYGLPTPLLDWTRCPYIAAYFAFFKKGTKCQTENRVVYALNRAVKRRCKGQERFVKFLDLDESSDETQNERLKKQRGKFTKALNGQNIEANVKKLAERKPYYQEKILLAEILIPNKIRGECLSFLESNKKITHGALFPDYGGAVEMCKIELGIDKFR